MANNDASRVYNVKTTTTRLGQLYQDDDLLSTRANNKDTPNEDKQLKYKETSAIMSQKARPFKPSMA